MKTIIAIDPGQEGAIAYQITHDERFGKPETWNETGVIEMPATITDLKDDLAIMKCQEYSVAYLEDVNVMPGQGSVSSGKFMRHVGHLEAMLIALNYKVVYVKPQVWQKHFSLLTKKTASGVKESKDQHKMRIVEFSQERFPDIKWTNTTDKDTKKRKKAIADALAILEYAKEKEK